MTAAGRGTGPRPLSIRVFGTTASATAMGCAAALAGLRLRCGLDERVRPAGWASVRRWRAAELARGYLADWAEPLALTLERNGKRLGGGAAIGGAITTDGTALSAAARVDVAVLAVAAEDLLRSGATGAGQAPDLSGSVETWIARIASRYRRLWIWLLNAERVVALSGSSAVRPWTVTSAASRRKIAERLVRQTIESGAPGLGLDGLVDLTWRSIGFAAVPLPPAAMGTALDDFVQSVWAVAPWTAQGDGSEPHDGETRDVA